MFFNSRFTIHYLIVMKKSKSTKPAPDKNVFGKSDGNGFLIAGVGASAGGIQALKIFFENVPKNSGAAYVVILHLSPEHDSKLSEVLQTVAKIPVTQVTERVRVEPNHVYVVSPNQSLSMNDGHIVVSPVHTIEERRAPIDIFFRTLAESHFDRAVCVVLSGTGADGSMGLKRVKERGGAVFVQNPREAEYSDMPRNSIATDLVDAVLPVSEIPTKITAYKKSLGTIEISLESEKRPDEQQKALREIFTHLRVRTGHDFSNYKRATVLRRIERRINVHQLSELPAYAAYLRENPDEAHSLLKDLLISATNFFRDKEAFGFLEREILPQITCDKTSGDQIRVWVAGCATGEEAYSIAMLLVERLQNIPDAPSVQIFATDIDETAVAAAREGFYTINDAADVSPERLHRFFNREQDGYRVRREIREMVLFAVHNLTKDPPFSRLDLATCRNLLIYFNHAAQERVMETLHFASNPGGYLFVGSSESIDGTSDLYAPVSKEHRVFQSRAVAAPRRPYSVSNVSSSQVRASRARLPETSKERENRVLERLSFADLHRRLLEQYAPPSIVVNSEYDIVHLSERAGRYLQMAGGEPSQNLLKLIRPELRLDLRTALYQAVQRQTNVEAGNLPVRIDDRDEIINIQVRPVLRPDDPTRGFLLVIFEPGAETREKSEVVFSSNEPVARQLEEELTLVKSQLRASVEQYENQTEELKASNEELQAMNEELRSSAEELETGKEELQSVNEELVTVNQELKIKIEEISQSNNDFQNLINSIDIATIFLDRSLRIKLFTPSVRDIFNLIPADIGRFLTDITSKLDYENLIADVETVLDKLQPLEREAHSRDNRVFLTRILPYRTSEDRISGVAITFLDITRHKRLEEEIRESDRELERQARLFSAPLSAISDFAYSFDHDGRFIYANRSLLDLLEIEAGYIVGKNFFDLDYPPELAENLQRQIRQVFDTKKALSDETHFTSPAGKSYIFEYIFSPLIAEDGSVEIVAGTTRDVTERRHIEQKARESEESSRLLIESATDYAIFTVTSDNLVDSWNTGAQKVFGFEAKEIIGQNARILFTPEDRERGVPETEIQRALETGHAEDERWHSRRDGSRFFASGVMSLLKKDGVQGFVKICRDQTKKIEAEKALYDREMLKKLISAQEDERTRIARDLHDELGQKLTALRLKLESIKKVCRDEDVSGRIDETQSIAEQIDNDVDFLAWELRPAALDDLGLFAALNNYAREWSRYAGVPIELHTSGLKNRRLAPEIETNLYRIAQEALNNTHKHAKAARANVLLERQEDTVVLIIEDDGRGFNPKTKTTRGKGLGLIGMRERAALVGGKLEIESMPQRGTTIFARVPALFAKKDG